MPHESSWTQFRAWRGRVGWMLLTLLLAAGSLVLHLRLAYELNDNPGARFSDQVEGRAARPYAYRALAPMLARAVDGVVPPSWTSVIGETPSVREFFVARGWLWEASSHEYVAGFLVMYAGLVGFGWSALAFYATFFPRPWPALLAAGSLAGVPFAWAQYGYLYDFPQLALYTAALALLARGRWGLYALAFPWLCLSKETSLLLIPLFLLQARGVVAPGRLRLLLAWQVGVWMTVRAALLATFASAPGGVVELHLKDHNLPMWRAWWQTGEGWSTFLAAMLIVAAVAWRLGRKPPFLRRCVWLAPPLLLLGSLFGYFEERRQYMELYAPVVALVVAALHLGEGSARSDLGAAAPADEIA